MVIMISGPNGSGKSTLTAQYIQNHSSFPKLYINADNLKKEYDLTDQAAQLKADELRQQALKERKSFAFETVMSHASKPDLLRQAKELGYRTELLFVSTISPQINEGRVQDRVASGGHDVPAERIEPRYHRSMNLLPHALKYADKARVFNNSFERPALIIKKDLDKPIEIYPQAIPSTWNEQKLKEFVGPGQQVKVVMPQGKEYFPSTVQQLTGEQLIKRIQAEIEHCKKSIETPAKVDALLKLEKSGKFQKPLGVQNKSVIDLVHDRIGTLQAASDKLRGLERSTFKVEGVRICTIVNSRSFQQQLNDQAKSLSRGKGQGLGR